MTVYFDLCDLKEIPFDGMDMVIVLSNLLDNAIRAAAQALPPEVHVRIRKTPEEYLLSVRNRVQDDLDLEDNKLPGTTKRRAATAWALPMCRRCCASTAQSIRSAAATAGSASPVPSRCAIHDMGTDSL